MWKWLRNIVLLAIVLAGALKLGVWYAVSHDAQRVVYALAPYAEVKYTGLAASLDGSVTISGVSVTPKGSRRIYRADSAAFDSPGLFWLVKHALLHDNDLPAQFGLTVTGLDLPPEPWLDALWLDPHTFALFASAGCESHLGADDWRRMGIDTTAPTRERFEYRFDAGQRTLVATLSLSAPEFATLALEADLSRFDPAKLMQSGFWDATHFDQLSTTYTDNGFMPRRDVYCAKREDLTSAQFADRHVAAVRALLQKSGIRPEDEVMQMYRTLAGNSGSLRLLSLPNAVFSVNAWNTTSREDLLRQLNVTARYQDKPPIMFRLTFTPVSESTGPLPAEPATAQAPAAPANSTPPAPMPNPPPLPVTTPAAILPPASSAKTIAPGPRPASARAAHPSPVSNPPPAPNPVPEKPTAPLSNPKPEDYLDRAEAKLPPPKIVAPAVVPAQKDAPSTDVSGASAPAPANATQALIWKPGVIEELPQAAPSRRDYSIVDYSALPQLSGRHVRLITLGGKHIEGFLVSADSHGLQLRIERGGGDALIAINHVSVVQVQLLHW